MCRLCKQYDEISDKVQEMPNNTADLVALTQYLEHASTALVMKLQTSVDEAAERLVFLLDYATLSRKLLCIQSFPFPLNSLSSLSLTKKTLNSLDEDIKLNSTVFHWPQHIQKIFELSRNRVGHRRDLAMDDLKKRYVKRVTKSACMLH